MRFRRRAAIVSAHARIAAVAALFVRRIRQPASTNRYRARALPVFVIAPRALCPARVLRRNQSDIGHQTRRRGEPARIAEFGGDCQGGQVVDSPEAAQTLDAWP